MDATRSAEQPTRRWIGRGRGVLSLSSQQGTPPTETRPGHQVEERLQACRGASSVNHTERSFSDLRMTDRHQQKPVHQPAERRPPTLDNRRPQTGGSDQREASSNGSNKGSRPLMQNGMADKNTSKVKSILAKFSYKANPESPLGFSELSIKQGQKLTLVEKHPTNEHWWKARDETGMVGYVPADYMKIEESKPSTLPWLANREDDMEVPSEKPVLKPYISAYHKQTSEQSNESEKNDYYCCVCDKKLNGPKPYGAHMTSKAHKEEVGIAREREECL